MIVTSVDDHFDDYHCSHDHFLTEAVLRRFSLHAHRKQLLLERIATTNYRENVPHAVHSHECTQPTTSVWYT
jgi:hypothetical protein